MWITSMGNHGAAGGISECRRSSCSSFILFQFQEEQDARHGAFSKTVLAAHDTNAGAAGKNEACIFSVNNYEK